MMINAGLIPVIVAIMILCALTRAMIYVADHASNAQNDSYKSLD